jgi:hypothetical protein
LQVFHGRQHAVRPVEVVVQAALNEKSLEFRFLVAVGRQFIVAVFVDAMRALNSAIELRASWRYAAVPYTSFR